MSETLTIDRLGAKGDGIAERESGPAYLPFTLPGETVAVENAAKARPRLAGIVTASPHRVAPPCPHFGTCGGCDLQHAGDELYRAFKRNLVVEALFRAGIETEVADLVPCAPNSRRRVALSAARGETGIALGFNSAGSSAVVDIAVCPIALPAIEAALPNLRALAKILVDRKRPLRLTVTATGEGLDIAAAGAGKLSEGTRRKAIAFSLDRGFARLTIDGERQMIARAPTLPVGDLAVEIPAGSFVQAVAASEAAMAEAVVAHLAGAKKIADLFAGFGAFALRLAPHSAVHAVEAEAAPLAAMDAAWRLRPGLKPLTTERRDLYRRPIPAKEFRFYDAVVFDPPRAGAEAVSQELAASKIGRVAAVSCNPVTLARDLALLVAGGFTVERVIPYDQFLWSHHVEAVALLSR